MANIIFGSEYEFLNTGIAADIALGIPSPSGFAVVYRDVPDSHHGTSRIGTVSGTVISYGSDYEFITTPAGQNTSVATLTPTKYVLAYGNYATTHRGQAKVADVSETTINFGAGYYYQDTSTGITEGAAATLELGVSGFLVAWEDPTVLGGSPDSFVKVGNVSGNVITFGSEVSFLDAAGVGINAVAIVSHEASGFVVIYNQATPQGKARVGSISGTDISYGPIYEFSDGGAEYVAATMLDSTRFVITYRDAADSNHGTAIVGTISGNTLTFGPETEFAPDGMDDQMAISRVNDNEFIVTYVDTNDGDIIKTKVGATFGTSIVFGEASQVKDSPGTGFPYFLRTKMLDDNRFVVVWRDESNSGHGTSMIGQVPETTFSDLFICGPELITDSSDLSISGAHPFISTSGDLFIQGPLFDFGEIDLFINSNITISVQASGNLFLRGLEDIQSSGNLYIQGPIVSSGAIDLFVEGTTSELLNDNIPLYVNGHVANTDSVDLFVESRDTLAVSGDLFIEGLDIVTVSGNTPLFTVGMDSDSRSMDLFIDSHIIFQASGNLYISGNVTTITDNFDLFIAGPTPVSGDIDLFVRGVTVLPPTSGDEGRAMDWFLRTSDYYPQIIGTFDSSISGVTIQVWDVVNAQNTSVSLTSSGCYSITDTGRWGWSTSNLPSLSGYQHQYYYLMTGDPSGTFDGQFFLEVPEDAKWAFPSSQDEYII